MQQQQQTEFVIKSRDLFAAVKEYKTPNAVYQMMSGDGALRSVVIEPETKQIQCVAPPKSLSLDEFSEIVPIENVFANEIIEGTMVNLFYDKNIGQWEIATKSAIGGDYWYFRTSYDRVSHQITFREMFLDALFMPRNTELNDVPLIATLDKTIIYSFVLQHPMNHIVLPIDFPRLFLVAAYHVMLDNATVISYPVRQIRDTLFANTQLISFPMEYEVHSFDDMPSVVGVMFHDTKNGFRLSVKNSEYERMREIRGNHPNLQYQYLELYAENRVGEFLNVFPQYIELFAWFFGKKHEYIDDLHNAYVAYFIQKRGKQIQIPKHIFVQIHKIHKEIYVGKRTTVRREMIETYVSEMTVSEQLFNINGGN